jgi:hypothetical protein
VDIENRYRSLSPGTNPNIAAIGSPVCDANCVAALCCVLLSQMTYMKMEFMISIEDQLH